MNYKSIITAAMLGTVLIASPGCKDEFAETNTNPSAITKADVRFLFTKALTEFEPSKYQQWFYNNQCEIVYGRNFVYVVPNAFRRKCQI